MATPARDQQRPNRLVADRFPARVLRADILGKDILRTERRNKSRQNDNEIQSTQHGGKYLEKINVIKQA